MNIKARSFTFFSLLMFLAPKGTQTWLHYLTTNIRNGGISVLSSIIIDTKKLLSSDWLRRECSSPVTRVQITKGLWLAEKKKQKQKKPTRTNQNRAVLTTKFSRKIAAFFSKQRFDFACKSIEHFKNIPKPEHSKKFDFRAKCIENVVLREKRCQQNRGKWARETKQAT